MSAPVATIQGKLIPGMACLSLPLVVYWSSFSPWTHPEPLRHVVAVIHFRPAFPDLWPFQNPSMCWKLLVCHPCVFSDDLNKDLGSTQPIQLFFIFWRGNEEWCLATLVLKFGCTLGNFKKYWCLGPTPRESDWVGLGQSLGLDGSNTNSEDLWFKAPTSQPAVTWVQNLTSQFLSCVALA